MKDRELEDAIEKGYRDDPKGLALTYSKWMPLGWPRPVCGFLSGAGLWNPQIQLQITPLFWGLAAFISRKKIACQVGPISVAIWFTFRGWKTDWKVLR